MYGFEFIPNTNKSEYDINSLLKVSSAPVIDVPEEIIREIKLWDGRKEYVHTGTYKDRIITLDCNFVESSKRAWFDKTSMIHRYFGDKQGILNLLSDDQEHYFKVKNVEISIKNRKRGFASELEIKFTCDPYRYLKNYSQSISINTDETKVFNNAFEISNPLYRIYNTSAESEALTIMNNKESFTIENPFMFVEITDGVQDQYGIDYIEIDTENECLKRVGNGADLLTGYRVTYDTVKTTGNFDSLKLKKGDNEIKSTIDKGIVSIEIFRNFREI